jgi:hypothetical protein
MLPKSSVNAIAVKKEDKEARLKAFISEQVECRLATSSDDEAGALITLVARSIDSPVVKALRAFESELSAKRAAVEVVLASETADRDAAMSLVTAGWSVRVLKDMRFRDAHEQLVIGAASAWIGDCMRRDPLKRDAFESFAGACPETVSRAATSFAHLWRRANPIQIPQASCASASGIVVVEDCPAPALPADAATDLSERPVALTRQ